MKKTLATLASVFALAAVGTIYPTTGVMISADTFRTASGLEYVYEYTEDIIEGDIVSVIMFDNFTPEDVRDDLIIAIRYSGVASDYELTR